MSAAYFVITMGNMEIIQTIIIREQENLHDKVHAFRDSYVGEFTNCLLHRI